MCGKFDKRECGGIEVTHSLKVDNLGKTGAVTSEAAFLYHFSQGDVVMNGSTGMRNRRSRMAGIAAQYVDLFRELVEDERKEDSQRSVHTEYRDQHRSHSRHSSGR